MRLKSVLFLSATCLAVLGIGGVLRWNITRKDVPKPDFMNLGAYQWALETSTNPASHAILQQILGGPSDLARERAAAQREGIRVYLTQLQRPMPPLGENAAPLYEQWSVLRRKTSFSLPPYAEQLRSSVAYTPAQLAAVQKVLDDQPDVMSLLHQATDKPQCVAPDDGELEDAGKAWKIILGHAFMRTTELREAVREISTESFLLAKQGRYNEAIADQSRGFRIAEHCASAPSQINYLVGFAIEGITLRGMQSILDLAGPNADVAHRVWQAISAHCNRLSLRYALSGDVAHTCGELDTLRATTPADMADVNNDKTKMSWWNKARRYTPGEKRFRDEILDATEASYIHELRRVIAVADGPFAVCMPIARSIDARPTSPLNPIDLLITKLTPLSGLQRLDEIQYDMRAQEQTFLAVAAIMEVHARTGGLPKNLPGKFSDPFDNDKPLKYRREGKTGFVVYSVGPTGKFNGGKPGEYRWEPVEVALRYPGPLPEPVPPDMLK